MTPLLEACGLSREFGGLLAVHDVSFAVARGQIKALIGPNGAGKTTIFNLISGVLAPTRGRVLFDGRPLPLRRPHAVAARGIARTFQLVRLFETMSVVDNVLVGCHRRGRAGWGACALRTRAARHEDGQLRLRALAILDRLGLVHRAQAAPTALSYGEQRLVELARALAQEPTLLLLDEPGAGLNATEQAQLAVVIRAIRDGGITVLIVDHHMEFVLELSDEVLVLCSGERLAEGAPAEVRANPAVIAAYLGDEAA